MGIFSRIVLVKILNNPLRSVSKILVSFICSSVFLAGFSAIATAEPTQITLSIDATYMPTFSDLVNQAASLAEIEISRQFQADPTISELQITVLGERNGQVVSLLLSSISRDEWQTSSNIHQWTRYFLTSSTLLGYDNSAQSSTPEPVATSRTPSSERASSEGASSERIPSELLENSRVSGRISEEEYWQLLDEMD